jgi:hypothetical protein
MERDEILLRDRIKNILQTYELEEILDQNEMTIEDCLVFLVYQYGLKLPDYAPL